MCGHAKRLSLTKFGIKFSQVNTLILQIFANQLVLVYKMAKGLTRLVLNTKLNVEREINCMILNFWSQKRQLDVEDSRMSLPKTLLQ